MSHSLPSTAMDVDPHVSPRLPDEQLLSPPSPDQISAMFESQEDSTSNNPPTATDDQHDDDADDGEARGSHTETSGSPPVADAEETLNLSGSPALIFGPPPGPDVSPNEEYRDSEFWRSFMPIMHNYDPPCAAFYDKAWKEFHFRKVNEAGHMRGTIDTNAGNLQFKEHFISVFGLVATKDDGVALGPMGVRRPPQPIRDGNNPSASIVIEAPQCRERRVYDDQVGELNLCAVDNEAILSGQKLSQQGKIQHFDHLLASKGVSHVLRLDKYGGLTRIAITTDTLFDMPRGHPSSIPHVPTPLPSRLQATMARAYGCNRLTILARGHR
ncbi:hypothetical protein SISNIDRAFT_487441 [Sistotremastrum niveocremeum HHB9708]|uniref:Uncharacterized protein n=1 Tax=Sistotremastrum niveocremeum HHB9708 TaxID=1314777 RepID=A0A164SGR7_9AGAM|nr:hypothetical protein SISNIDRAFT_487441 [Sistotremastrum niveocremeum HHB9708]